MLPSLHIIGLGVAEKAQLSSEAEQALCRAQLVIGSKRQHQTLSTYWAALDNTESDKQPPVRCMLLPKLTQLQSLIDHSDCEHIAILASGDPLYFGIGRWFTRHYATGQLYFYPAVSSIQAACHRLQLSQQDISVVSLHGRPLSTIRTWLKANTTLLLLTDRNSHPEALARECIAAGFAQSTLSVCENLGYATEKITTLNADQWLNSVEVDPLHITVIKVRGAGGVLPQNPGIPDTHYVTQIEQSANPQGNGMITKREVRLVILAFIQPTANDVIWDIGAGCGGVSVELSYWNRHASVYAIEHHPERFACLNANRERFGVVDNLHSIEGRAPAALLPLPPANKIFIGGSDGQLSQLLAYAWQVLPDGGMLVASAVTEKSRQLLIDFIQQQPDTKAESVEVGIKRGAFQGSSLQYNSKRPVEIFQIIKQGKQL